MKVQAEVSLYPLRTQRVGEAVARFLEHLRGVGLNVEVGTMSTQMTGESERVFETLGKAFQDTASHGDAVLVVKVSNACPTEPQAEPMTV